MKQGDRYGAFLLIALSMLLAFVLLSPTGVMDTARVKTADLSARGAAGAGGANTVGVVKSALPAFPIDINKAPVDTLTLLPGVGKKLAMRIIEHRESSGGFKTGEDLIEVKGIGEKKLEKILPLVTAG